MNVKSYVFAVIASYFAMAIAGVVSDLATREQMASLLMISRGEEGMAAMMGWMLFGYLVSTILFCYIFVKGRDNGGVGEGVRFGAIFGVAMCGPILVNYSIFPYEMIAMVTQAVLTVLIYIIGGIVASLVYKPAQ